MQFRKHALLPLSTAAAVCLCVPSAGASVARTAVSSRTLVSGSQSTSVVSIAIGHNRVPTRGQGTPDRVLRTTTLGDDTLAQAT